MKAETCPQNNRDKTWNKCDVCGKFISMDDFNSGKALREMATPDTHLTCEEFTTLCKNHRNEYK